MKPEACPCRKVHPGWENGKTTLMKRQNPVEKLENSRPEIVLANVNVVSSNLIGRARTAE